MAIFCRHPQNAKALLIPKVSAAPFRGMQQLQSFIPASTDTEFGEQMWVFLCGMRSQPDPPPKTRHRGDDLTDIPHSSSCTRCLSLCSLFWIFFFTGEHQGFAQAFKKDKNIAPPRSILKALSHLWHKQHGSHLLDLFKKKNPCIFFPSIICS